VGLEDVAVEDDGVLAEGLVVDDRAQRAADEPADLVGAAADPATDGFPVASGVGGAGQLAVLGGDPAVAAAFARAGDAFGDDGGGHLGDAVGAGGLEGGLVDLACVDDLGAQAGDAAFDLFDVVDAAEPGDDLLSLGGHVPSPWSEPKSWHRHRA